MKSGPSFAIAIDLEALAEMVADRVIARLSGNSPRYASAVENPLGSSRAFLDAHRAGRFPTFKRGREVLAKWADVEAYIESRRTRPSEHRAEKDQGDVASLAKMAPKRRGRAA